MLQRVRRTLSSNSRASSTRDSVVPEEDAHVDSAGPPSFDAWLVGTAFHDAAQTRADVEPASDLPVTPTRHTIHLGEEARTRSDVSPERLGTGSSSARSLDRSGSWDDGKTPEEYGYERANSIKRKVYKLKQLKLVREEKTGSSKALNTLKDSDATDASLFQRLLQRNANVAFWEARRGVIVAMEERTSSRSRVQAPEVSREAKDTTPCGERGFDEWMTDMHAKIKKRKQKTARKEQKAARQHTKERTQASRYKP